MQDYRRNGWYALGGALITAGVAWLIGWGVVVASASRHSGTRFWLPPSFAAVSVCVLGFLIILAVMYDWPGRWRAVKSDPIAPPVVEHHAPEAPAVSADDLTVTIDKHAKHVIEQKAVILEIDYSVTNNSDAVRKITPVRLDGSFYFPAPDDIEDVEVARIGHEIEERRRRDQLPSEVRPHETAHGVWVATFGFDVPLRYALTVKDDFDRPYTAESPVPPLLVTIAESHFEPWVRAAYIAALRVEITNTTGRPIRLGRREYLIQHGFIGLLQAEVTEAEKESLAREVAARQRSPHYAPELSTLRVVAAGESTSGWLVLAVRRGPRGGTPRCTVTVKDNIGNRYPTVIERREPEVY